VLPEFTSEGDLPIGVYKADWQEFQSRFGAATSRRAWLFGRSHALLELAAKTGELRRVFVWGSFVTAKPAPKDIDILLIMHEDLRSSGPPRPHVSSSIPSRRSCCSKTRYCGTGASVIQTDDQMLLAQQCVSNLRKVLLEARKVHSRQDYLRLAEPILLEVQQREREILEYLSGDRLARRAHL
jgi:hypothetical protein